MAMEDDAAADRAWLAANRPERPPPSFYGAIWDVQPSTPAVDCGVVALMKIGRAHV